MTSFLGLIHAIRLNPTKNDEMKQAAQPNDLVMTQYLLKLLTILTNILARNVIILT